MEIATKLSPICLAIIMFGLGLGLTVGDFFRVVKNPRDFVIGFLLQVILLPIIAFMLIKIIIVPPEIALGVMIIAAAPGGVTSNILTKFAGGDVALSVCLTAVVSLLCIFTMPLIIYNVADLLDTPIMRDLSILNNNLTLCSFVCLGIKSLIKSVIFLSCNLATVFCILFNSVPKFL